jgi:hypothetical protein
MSIQLNQHQAVQSERSVKLAVRLAAPSGALRTSSATTPERFVQPRQHSRSVGACRINRSFSIYRRHQ